MKTEILGDIEEWGKQCGVLIATVVMPAGGRE
jgi:hypothetical protein